MSSSEEQVEDAGSNGGDSFHEVKRRFKDRSKVREAWVCFGFFLGRFRLFPWGDFRDLAPSATSVCGGLFVSPV